MSDTDNTQHPADEELPDSWPLPGFQSEKPELNFEEREHRLEPGDGSTIPIRMTEGDDRFRSIPDPRLPAAEDESSSESRYSLSNPPTRWGGTGPAWHRVEKVSPTRPAGKPHDRKQSREWLVAFSCNLLVFLASVCVMVIELTASRLIAKHVGNSLYTWTSVIGVVLAGITLGNFLGGWLADRFVPERILPKLFLFASAACFSILWMDRVVYDAVRPDGMDMPTWVFLIVAEMFLLPALSLGTISPVVASIALKRSTRTGITVGNVYAWGALGSIVGTFLAGFWLIDQFGTRMIVGGTAGTLALIGAIVASKQIVFRTAVIVGWLQFLLVTTVASAATADGIGGFAESFGYFAVAYDHDVVALRKWRDSHWGAILDAELRTRLGTRCANGDFPKLDNESQTALCDWMRSGSRDHLDEQSANAIDELVLHYLRNTARQQEWKAYGQSLGRSLHEVGVLLFLRSDNPNQYHDESNYSYINVRTAYDDEYGEEVTQLMLDKLVHSYFSPENPTRLYYEYELIYAELTERVTQNWKRGSTATVDRFPGADEIVARLPEWAAFDQTTHELTVTGVVTADRRAELLRLTPAGDYWLALESLAEQTQDAYWGGFSSTPLDALPDGADQSRFLTDRLKYDGTLHRLNVFRELDDADVAALCRLGEAAKWTAWRDAVDRVSEGSRKVATFFIGGGGYVFPRWIEATFPSRSRIDVAEIDPAVTVAVRKMMGLKPENQTQVKTLTGDARNVVAELLRRNQQLANASEKQPVVEYDFIYGDAFNDFAVPWHLTTIEFTQQVRRLLNPQHGVFLINVIDALPRTESDVLPATALPENMLVEGDLFSEWQFAPEPFSEIEILSTGNDEYQLGVRGVMSPRLYSRLRGEDQSSRLHVVADDLLSRSQSARGGRFLSSYVKTLAEVFPNVYVFSTSHGTPHHERDTFVIAASVQPLALTDLPLSGHHWDTAPFASLEADSTGQPIMSGQMGALMATARGLILTDDYAPVDNLLRPVFANQE